MHQGQSPGVPLVPPPGRPAGGQQVALAAGGLRTADRLPWNCPALRPTAKRDLGRRAVIGENASRPAAASRWTTGRPRRSCRGRFQHIADLFRHGRDPARRRSAQPLPVRLSAVADILVLLHDGTRSSVGAVMDATHTDGWMVVHRGVVWPRNT